jgi:glycosyltransferase involved in cell wall biosynthesis
MATPPKILYAITKSNFGGAQRYVFELALAMRAAGYEVAVAAGGNGELLERLAAAGIKTYQITAAQRDIAWRKEVAVLQSLRQILTDFKPDIIHLNSSKLGGLGALTARLCRVPHIVFTAHGWPHHEERHWSWRLMAWVGSYLTALLSHQVITVSQFDAKRTYFFGTKGKTTVIHNALFPFTLLERTHAREKLLPPEVIAAHARDIWLVTHGEINHNKNHTTAIDAVADFNQTHSAKIFYVIIGSGELQGALAEQVSLRGMREHVIFLDHVPEVRTLLLAFDLYIMPSLKEGLPYALLEAGYAGLPVLASNVGGIPEVIHEGETGLLFDPHTHTGMTDALALLINEPEQRSLYTKNLRAHIETHFNPETMLKATQAIYDLRQH